MELGKSYQKLKELNKDDKNLQELYLSNCIFSIVLAPYGNEQHDLLHRILLNEKKLLESLAVYRELLVLLTTWELISWPLPKQLSNNLSTFKFNGINEPNQNFDQLLRDRIVEHVMCFCFRCLLSLSVFFYIFLF